MSKNSILKTALMTVATAAMVSTGTLAADNVAAHRAQYTDDIPLGTSVGPYNECSTGTAGALVQNSGGVYVLSNNHVLASTNTQAIGASLTHVGVYQVYENTGSCDETQTTIWGELENFESIYTHRRWRRAQRNPNTVDGAIGLIDISQCEGGPTGCWDPNGSVLDVGVIDPNIEDAYVGLQVQKGGRTTGHTTGTITAVDVDSFINYGTQTSPVYGYFTGQIEIVSNDNDVFSDSGDSGSLIATNPGNGSDPQPVGLLFAGGGGSTLANPIRDVLSALNVEMFGCGAGDDCGGSSSSFNASSASAGDAVDAAAVRAFGRKPEKFDTARAAKRKNKEKFVRGGEVHGMGIGMNASGEAVIRVYVKKGKGANIPSQIDGVDVQIVERDAFMAY